MYGLVVDVGLGSKKQIDTGSGPGGVIPVGNPPEEDGADLGIGLVLACGGFLREVFLHGLDGQRFHNAAGKDVGRTETETDPAYDQGKFAWIGFDFADGVAGSERKNQHRSVEDIDDRHEIQGKAAVGKGSQQLRAVTGGPVQEGMGQQGDKYTGVQKRERLGRFGGASESPPGERDEQRYDGYHNEGMAQAPMNNDSGEVVGFPAAEGHERLNEDVQIRYDAG